MPSGSSIADNACLDIAEREFWKRCEMTFFDVKVFNPYSKTHLNQNLNAAFTRNEREKKRQYNQRVYKWSVLHNTTSLQGVWRL